MQASISTFGEVMHLEQHGPDTYVGLSPEYHWGRVYGGQVICQGLWAAMQTVDERFVAHSVHAYFIRGGTISEPIRYEVDRLRDGRSFCTRAVVARQSGGAILNLSCSFHIKEQEAEVQTARIPPAPSPNGNFTSDTQWWPWIMERQQLESLPGSSQALGWVRIIDPVPDEARQHICGLAFTSDSVHFDAARSLHPLQVPREQYHEKFMGASLDHAIWFHRPLNPNDWHLYHFVCNSLTGARGMTVGNLFSADGVHVATIAQEVLLRERVVRS